MHRLSSPAMWARCAPRSMPGAAAARPAGELVSVHVIARPHDDLQNRTAQVRDVPDVSGQGNRQRRRDAEEREVRGHEAAVHPALHHKDGKLVASGSSVVAVDSVGAGQGECVLFTQGSSARLTQTTKDAPVDAVIVGIVDSVEVDGAIVEKP